VAVYVFLVYFTELRAEELSGSLRGRISDLDEAERYGGVAVAAGVSG
jgi:hypothetical protein